MSVGYRVLGLGLGLGLSLTLELLTRAALTFTCSLRASSTTGPYPRTLVYRSYKKAAKDMSLFLNVIYDMKGGKDWLTGSLKGI